MDDPTFLVTALTASLSALIGSGAVQATNRWLRGLPADDAASVDDATVERTYRKVAAEVGAGGTGTPEELSPAQVEAVAIMSVYLKDLLQEADRIAKRARADRPSKDHVRFAADRVGVLRSRAGVLSDLAVAIGSILLGGAGAYQINLLTGGVADEGSNLWMLAALSLGAGLFVGGAVIKWKAR